MVLVQLKITIVRLFKVDFQPAIIALPFFVFKIFIDRSAFHQIISLFHCNAGAVFVDVEGLFQTRFVFFFLKIDVIGIKKVHISLV